MNVGERIKERLADSGMSQSELARRVRLTQPAINALIRGSSRTSLNLHRIARELGTTPAYLTGETNDPAAESPPDPLLSSDARVLLDCFEELGAADRAAVLRHALSLAGKLPPPGERVHAPRQDFSAEAKR